MPNASSGGAGGGITEAQAISAVEGEATLDLAGDVTIEGTKSLAVDVISEKDAAAGVTIDSVLLKDGLVDGIDVAIRDHAKYLDAAAIAAVEAEASLVLAGTIEGTEDTEATSPTVAAVKTAGGLAVAKALFVGNDANVLGDRIHLGPTGAHDRHKQVIRGIDDVSTTPVEIIANTDAATGVLAIVTGREEGASHFFKDLIITGFDMAPTVIQSFTVLGSPQARTYAKAGANYGVVLTMAANTYNISVWFLQGDNTT